MPNNTMEPLPFKGKWKLLGHDLCARKFRNILGLSRRNMQCWQGQIARGLVAPLKAPWSKRKAKPETPQRLHVRAWLLWVYEHQTHDFATTRDQVNKAMVDELPCDDKNLDMQASLLDPTDPMVNCREDIAKLRPRTLPPGTPSELRIVYNHLNAGHADLASKSTFHREFRRWENVILFQRITEHATCTLCGEYVSFKKTATSVAEIKAICDKHAEHLKDVFAMREMEAFYHRESVESTRPQAGRVVIPDLLSWFLRVEIVHRYR